jgi:4-hydroxyphenylpyruvate dioxygenase
MCEPDLVAGLSSAAEVRQRAAKVRRRAASLELNLEVYQPLRDFEGEPDGMLVGNLRRAEEAFGLMGELGAGTLLVCSSCSETAIDDDQRAAGQLRRLAELADRRGVRIAYEALSWARHVRSFRRAWELVSVVDHPALGLALDSFHILDQGEDPAAIRDIPGERIFVVQLADAPAMNMDRRTKSCNHRRLPGRGDLDLTGFTAAVLASGYRGPLSLEIFNPELQQADPGRTAADAMQSLRALKASIQQAAAR